MECLNRYVPKSMRKDIEAITTNASTANRTFLHLRHYCACLTFNSTPNLNTTTFTTEQHASPLRQDFLSYIRNFNTRSYEHQHSFYAPDITMTLPDPAVPVLHGPDAISKHYAQVHGVAGETVVPMIVVTEDDHVFFEMEVYFKYFVDTERGVHSLVLREGDVFRVTVWALYVINDQGKMQSIRCDLWEEKMLGQVEVEPLLGESRSRAQKDLR